MIFLLIQSSVSLEPQESLNTIIGGKWKITEIDVTQTGYENPDQREFNICFVEENNKTQFEGTLTPVRQYDNSYITNVRIILKNELIQLYFNDSLFIEAPYEYFSNSLQIGHGFLPDEKTYYSFVFMSVFRSEITLFNRETGDIKIYRMMHEISHSGESILKKIIKFIMQRLFFSLIH